MYESMPLPATPVHLLLFRVPFWPSTLLLALIPSHLSDSCSKFYLPRILARLLTDKRDSTQYWINTQLHPEIGKGNVGETKLQWQSDVWRGYHLWTMGMLNRCFLEHSREEGISFMCKVMGLVFLLIGVLENTGSGPPIGAVWAGKISPCLWDVPFWSHIQRSLKLKGNLTPSS